MRRKGLKGYLFVIFFLLYLNNVVFADLVFTHEGNSSEVTERWEDIVVETSTATSGKWTIPYVSAHSAILMDTITGDILYARDIHNKRPIASTTKILTAIVGLEIADLDEVATISLRADAVGESTIHLSKGDRILLGELIEGALVRSGNDACVAIAEQTAGSYEEFIQLMNLKAVNLGATNSNFTNPHGLPDKDHYSTAYDLALIARYAMEDQTFAKIVAQKVSTINFQSPNKSQIAKNTNKLLWNYPLADGIKTGTTNAAGKCLVASGSKDGRRLLCVVLNAPDRFGDAQRLINWGFQNTILIEIGKKGSMLQDDELGTAIPVVFGEDIQVCLETDQVDRLRTETQWVPGMHSFVKSGDVLGYLHVYLGQQILKSVPLLSAQDNNGKPTQISSTFHFVVGRFLDFINKKE